MYIELAIFALFVFCYTLIAGRLERAPASGPIVFVASGFVMGPLMLGWFDGDVSRTELQVLADLTLAVILFVDIGNSVDKNVARDSQVNLGYPILPFI